MSKECNENAKQNLWVRRENLSILETESENINLYLFIFVSIWQNFKEWLETIVFSITFEGQSPSLEKVLFNKYYKTWFILSLFMCILDRNFLRIN
jgi:hypothetical protein